jgi:hypothetical protein
LGHELEEVIEHVMDGSTKPEREAYEHYVLQKYGGANAPGILNKVNPMGGRLDKYNDMIESVIQKYNLPR